MTRHQSKPAALIALAALCAAGCATSSAQPPVAPLHACIAREATKSSFSGVISISRPGAPIVHTNGFMAEPGGAPMLADAQFNIGSAGKMFTAVAAAQLADAGKIKLDDPIGNYVSGLTPEAAGVTIRQLLTHSGGMGNFFTPDNLDVISRARATADLKPLVNAQKPEFPPGSRTKYSNTGFLLIGLMIESVSGLSYGDYLQKNIFAPAGMAKTSVTPGAPSTRAVGMTNFPDMPDGPPPGPPPGAPKSGPPQPGPEAGPGMFPPPGPLRRSAEAVLPANPAGGGFSTPSDMQKFFTALLGGRLTSPAMLKELTSRQVTLLPPKGPLPAVYYGLGMSISDFQGHEWIGHNGGLPGANISTMAFPKDETIVIVMSNRDPPVADMMIRRVQAALFDKAACAAP